MIELPAASAYWKLFISMLKEEWRLQRSFVGSFGAFFFPVVILFFSFVLVLIFPFEEASTSSVVDIIHVMMFSFGIGVGGIALMGEQVMTRKIGQVNLLMKISQLQPIPFKKVMLVFFLKEVFFYHLYSVIPFGAGMLIAGMINGLPLPGLFLVSLTISLVFTLGMSLSFLISGILV